MKRFEEENKNVRDVGRERKREGGFAKSEKKEAGWKKNGQISRRRTSNEAYNNPRWHSNKQPSVGNTPVVRNAPKTTSRQEITMTMSEIRSARGHALYFFFPLLHTSYRSAYTHDSTRSGRFLAIVRRDDPKRREELNRRWKRGPSRNTFVGRTCVCVCVGSESRCFLQSHVC